MGSRQKEHYTVWVDGSAYSPGYKKTRTGAGWVIRDDDTGELRRRTHPMPELASGSSMVAEFHAAAHALRTLPKDSVVALHTDCLAVKRYLTTGNIPKMNSSSDATRQAVKMAADFLWEVQKNYDLIVEWKDRAEDRRQLRRAHHLARYAASRNVAL